MNNYTLCPDKNRNTVRYATECNRNILAESYNEKLSCRREAA